MCLCCACVCMCVCICGWARNHKWRAEEQTSGTSGRHAVRLFVVPSLLSTSLSLSQRRNAPAAGRIVDLACKSVVFILSVCPSHVHQGQKKVCAIYVAILTYPINELTSLFPPCPAPDTGAAATKKPAWLPTCGRHLPTVVSSSSSYSSTPLYSFSSFFPSLPQEPSTRPSRSHRQQQLISLQPVAISNKPPQASLDALPPRTAELILLHQRHKPPQSQRLSLSLVTPPAWLRLPVPFFFPLQSK